MLDNNKKINLAHLRSLHPRVTFHCVDLYAPEALELVRDAVALHGFDSRRRRRGALVRGPRQASDATLGRIEIGRARALAVLPGARGGRTQTSGGEVRVRALAAGANLGVGRVPPLVSVSVSPRGWRTEGTSLVVTTRRWRVRIPPDANATSTPWMMGARVEGRDGTSTGTRT